jgi:hypothetical protein
MFSLDTLSKSLIYKSNLNSILIDGNQGTIAMET